MTPLNQTTTGGFSLVKLLFIIAGIAFLVMQVIVLMGWNAETEASTASKIAPGIAGLVALGYALLFLGKTGFAEIGQGRLKGQTASGRKYDIAVSDIGSVDLDSRLLAAKDKQDKILLLDKTSHNPHFAGILALRVAYPELPEAFWEGLNAASSEESPRLIRYFLDNEGNRAFFDAGFVQTIGSSSCFMPTHDTLPATRAVRNDQSLSTMSSGTAPILKFNPNPQKLPSHVFLPALATHSAEKAMEYVESHGGCVLQAAGEGWTGEVGGFAVVVEG